MKEKATIYDFARMCNCYRGNVGCVNCPLYISSFDGKMERCYNHIALFTDSANDKIVEWCEEHAIKTRQSEFLKMFPNARITFNAVDICPKGVDTSFICCPNGCRDCKKSYWLAEVEE